MPESARISEPRAAMEADVISAASASTSWVMGGRSPADTMLRFTAALKIRPESARILERVFFEVSDPKHPSYGQYWSRAKVTALLQPEPHHVKAVTAFLLHISGVNPVFVGQLVSFDLKVSEAEAAFGTKFHVFKHRSGAVVHRAPSGYSLPLEVARAVSCVEGVVRLPQLRQPDVNAMATSPLDDQPFPVDTCSGKCRGLITPAIISARYNIGDAPTKASISNKSSMAIAEFQDQGWDQSDCDKLSAACKIQNITVDKQMGGPPYGGPSTEALLDIQYIKAIGGAIPLTNVYS